MGKDLSLHKMRKKSIPFMSANIDIELKGTRYVISCYIFYYVIEFISTWFSHFMKIVLV